MKIKHELTLERGMEEAKEIVSFLEPYCAEIIVAGSIRRRKKIVRDVDIVVIPNNDEVSAIHQAVNNIRLQVLSGGNKRLYFMWKPDVEVNLTFTNTLSYTPCLLYFTGSQWFNIKCRSEAKKLGMKLNEYFLTGPEGKIINDKHWTEGDILQKIGIGDVAPEMRI